MKEFKLKYKFSLNFNQKIFFSFLLFFIFGLGFGAKANAAIYYVDCNAANDNGAGTSEGTAWKTIAKVNATLTGDQSDTNVLFKKDCTWREQLTVPGSGTSGHPFTFGEYGTTGAKPIINGSDQLNYTTAWTKYPGNLFKNPSVELWSGSACTDWTGGAVGSSAVSYDTSTVHTGSKSLKFTVDSSNSDVSQGETTTACLPSTEYTLSFWYNIPVGKTAKWIFKNYTSGNWLNGSSAWVGSDPNNSLTGTGSWEQKSITFTTESNASPTIRFTLERLSSASSNLYFDDISLVSTATPTNTIWGYRMPTGAYQYIDRVWFDSTEGNKVAAYVNLASDMDWYSDGTYLWVYSSTEANPASRWTIEAMQRYAAILANKDYITIDGLHLTKAIEDIYMGNGSNVTGGIIRNCLIDYSSNSNVGFGRHGPNYTASGCLVENNEISHAGMIPPVGQHIYHGVYLEYSSDCIVQNNVFHDNIQGYDIQIQDTGSNNIVRRNISNGSNGFLVISNNVSTLPTETQAYYNVMSNLSGGIAFSISGNYSEASNSIYNNTVYVAEYGLYKQNNSTVNFKNNIVWSATNAIRDISSSGLVSDNNLLGPEGTAFIIWGGTSYDSLTTYQTASSQDIHSVNADPKFVSSSNFHLQSTSPAINAGTDVDLTEDYAGNPVPSGNGFDIGAYEYQADTTPDAFVFTDITNASLSTEYTSNTIAVAGIDDLAAITITGGTYSKNGGAYTANAGTVANGDTVTVRVTSSGSFSTAVNTVLTIGGVSDTYTVTTLDDTVPDAFTFTDITDATLSTQYTSNQITVAGINAAAAISITGGTYSINGGAYTSNAGTVSVGNQVTVKTTSSASYSTAMNVALTIGGVSDTYTVTTLADTTGPTLSFTQNVEPGPVQSDTITPSWGDATVMKYRYNDDNNCPTDAGVYTGYTDSALNQTNESHNGKFICLYGADDLGNYTTLASANDINIDTTGPTITINNPNTNPAQSKTITASATESAALSYHINDAGDDTCSGSLSFTAYASIDFTSESDNGKKVCYKAVDAVNNTTYSLSNALAGIDTTGPTLSFTQNVEAGPVQSDTITPGWGDATVTKYRYNDDNNCPTNPGVYTDYIDSALNQTDETHNGKFICLYGADDLGNYTTFASANDINIDATLPVITINNPNTSYAQSKTITASATESATLSYHTNNSGVDTCNGSLSFTAYSSLTFSSESDNGKKVCYKAVDSTNNISYSLSNAIAGIDLTPPTDGIFTINNGAAYTNSTSVTLNITCPTDDWAPIEMAYGDSLNLTNWETCIASKSWTLPTGDGTKIVYMRFRDGGGNTTEDTTDTISLDTIGPETIIDSHPDASTTSTLATFEFSSDDESAALWCKLEDADYAICTSSKDYTSLALGAHTFSVKAIDSLDNEDPTPAEYSWTISEIPAPVNTDENNDNERDLNVHNIKAESTENSITITWKTDYNAESTVRYGTDKSLKLKKNDNSKEKKHKVILKDLLSDTLYYFRIKAEDGNDNEDSSRIHSIKTLTNTDWTRTDAENTKPSDSGQETLNRQSSVSAQPNTCSYTVESGDTLWDIAKKVYGDATTYPLIIEKNKDKYIDIGSKLSIGQELRLCDNN